MAKSLTSLRRAAGGSADELQIQPQPVSAAFLKRIPGLGAEAAAQAVAALSRAGLLTQDGHLSADPRGSPWRQAIRATPGLGSKLPGVRPGVQDSLKADESAMSEVRASAAGLRAPRACLPEKSTGRKGSCEGPRERARARERERERDDTHSADASFVWWQVLNVAWAMHEITSDRWEDTLAFIRTALQAHSLGPSSAGKGAVELRE